MKKGKKKKQWKTQKQKWINVKCLRWFPKKKLSNILTFTYYNALFFNMISRKNNLIIFFLKFNTYSAVSAVFKHFFVN